MLTAGRLDELVPIQNAAMEDRTVIEWDKDDLDALKIYKVDVLALGMLTALRKSFELIKQHYGEEHGLDMPTDDDKVYEMLCKANSVGVFQVESRAQMSMLPRLKPRKYYDLVVEVAIVRPGPIQGGMVHPYLQEPRGLAEDQIAYPSDKLKNILKRTRGVPLFQEQAMQIAIDCAGFLPAKADKLRRAMATFRRSGTIHKLKDDFINGMVEQRVRARVRRALLQADRGLRRVRLPREPCRELRDPGLRLVLGEVVPSRGLRRGPAQLPADGLLRAGAARARCPRARRRGAAARRECQRLGLHAGEDRAATAARCASASGRSPACREADLKRMVERRTTPYRDPADLWRRGGLNKRQILALARADAFASMGLTRRDVLWAVRAFSEASLPLFDARPQVRDLEPAVSLPKLTLGEQVVDDYSTISMSLRAHPLQLLRPTLSERRMAHSEKLREARNGDFLQMAGLVLVRQRPGTASGVVFVTLEDEFGIANLVVWPTVFEDPSPDRHGRAPAGRRGQGPARRAADGNRHRDPSRRRAAVGLVGRSRPHRRSRRPLRAAHRPRRPGPFLDARPARRTQAPADPEKAPAKKPPYDRSRIIFDRPQIKIASRDFH